MRVRDVRGGFRLTPHRIAVAIKRRAMLPANYVRLVALSRMSRSAVVNPASDVTVTLTTHGPRLETVHLTIESIARGTYLPGRIILYLDAPMPSDLPPGLTRLMRRGLELRESAGRFGPHTKYFPYVSDAPEGSGRHVTADDDIVYPREWLEELVTVSDAHPKDIVCHRAHLITLDDTGERLLPYIQWEWAGVPGASHRNFLTGVSGVLYPEEMQSSLRMRGSAFMEVCPRADDIWLNWVALRSGIKVRQVADRPHDYPTLMSTQAVSLLSSNVDDGANNAQFDATYSAEDVRLLRALGDPRSGSGSEGSGSPR